jgi:aspartyl-tRNA synthetase
MVELTDTFANTGFGVFKKIVGEGGAIKGIVLKGKALSRKDLDDAVDAAKGMGSGGLIWMRKEADKLASPIVKFLSEQEISGIIAQLGVQDGDVIYFRFAS